MFGYGFSHSSIGRRGRSDPFGAYRVGDAIPALVLDFARKRYSLDGTTPTDFPLTFSRASQATYWNGSQIVTAGVDEPRIEPKGLLVERQSTNIFKTSEDFGVNWFSTNANVSGFTTAPTGAQTATRLIDTGSGGTGEVRLSEFSETVTGGDNLFSVFARADTVDLLYLDTAGFDSPGISYFDLTNGTVANLGAGHLDGGVDAYPDGWYRCWVRFDTATDLTGNLTFGAAAGIGDKTVALNGTSKIHVWGAQLESGTFPTSYIPTNGAQVTRAADQASLATADFGFNAAAGAIVAEWAAPHSENQRVWELNASSASDRIMVYRQSNGNITLLSSISGATSGGVGGVITTDALPHRTAAAWQSDDYALSTDGSAVNKDITATVPTGLINLWFGSELGVGAPLNGHITSLVYFPERLSDDDLVESTS